MAKLARDKGALAHGLVLMVGSPVPLCILWMQIKDALVTLIAEDDSSASDDLHRMLVPVMRTFFKDVHDVAPGLATLRLC